MLIFSVERHTLFRVPSVRAEQLVFLSIAEDKVMRFVSFRRGVISAKNRI